MLRLAAGRAIDLVVRKNSEVNYVLTMPNECQMPNENVHSLSYCLK